MENEGSSALQSETPKDNIIPFPGTKIDALPSEKVHQFELPKKPDMQTLDFLLWLPKGRSGFRFQTDRAIPKGPQKYDEATAELIRKKTTDQMGFTQGKLAKQALDNYRQIPSTEQDNKFLKQYSEVRSKYPKLAEKMLEDVQSKQAETPKIKAFIEYEKARKNYLDRSSPKVGIRNLRISGDTITVDPKPVDYHVNAAIGSINSSPEDLERGTISATSGNVIFAPDRFGKRKLGLMLRSERNGNWRDVPGTLIAGFFDGKIDTKPSKLSPHQGRRTLQKIDNASIFENAHKELHEEIGIEEKDVKRTVTTGLALEKKNRAHHEFLVDVELKLTPEQAREKSDKFEMEHPEEFKEEWTTIDYSPEAIQTLLTKVLCPLPDSHYASFAATGRMLVAQTKGEKAAEEYMKQLEIGIAENKERINSTVRKYVRENPEILNNPTANQLEKINKKVAQYTADNPQASDEDKEKFKQNLIDNRVKFNPDAFNPALLPEEQGLNDALTALKQAGLINDNVVELPQQQAKAA
ncbi:MAG: hypothetical protein Q7T54_01730 [Candidatus Levybacteria bacterium]|nr:hypothetical protein [Candidatus Levybacteria bacterium]